MLKVEIYRNINENIALLDFIGSQKDISVFQTNYFLNLYNRTKGLEGIMFAAFRDGIVTGLMLVQIQNYFGAALGFMTRRAIIIGGPYTIGNDGETAGLLLSEYRKYIGGKVVYTQVRRLTGDNVPAEIFANSGFSYSDHLNYLVDLESGEEICWKNLHQKRRNEIRKAVKEGVTFSEIDYASETDKAYAVLKEIYGRAGLPLPETGFFADALELMGSEGIFRIFGGYFDGKLIGVMYVLCYNGVVYDWYAGSYYEYLKKCPNDLITWEVIKTGISEGYKTFDFGGAGNPSKEYGVRDFKKKFGGKEYNTGRFEFVHKPFTMKIAETGFRFLQTMKRKK